MAQIGCGTIRSAAQRSALFPYFQRAEVSVAKENKKHNHN
jgi:hypothetical protein